MDIARQSLAIAFVLALLWGAICFLRKKAGLVARGDKAEPGRLESRGKLALTAQHSVHLVQAGDRSLVLAVHPGGVTLLADAKPQAGDCVAT
jgi:flagellar biogenesis protein FliO